MSTLDGGVPRIVLPERVDRSVRLGPFPSARDAVKFLGYAAVGAVLAPFLPVYVWVLLPIAGLAFAVGRIDQEPVDEQILRWGRYQLRLPGRSRTVSPAPGARTHGPLARRADGRYVAVIRTHGMPLAYRPPSDQAVLFEQFRDSLLGIDALLVIHSATSVLDDRSLCPASAADLPEEGAARAGYSELIHAVCRRRRRRRVDLFLVSQEGTPEGGPRLRQQAHALVARLAPMDLEPRLLQGRTLDAALAEIELGSAGGRS